MSDASSGAAGFRLCAGIAVSDAGTGRSACCVSSPHAGVSPAVLRLVASLMPMGTYGDTSAADDDARADAGRDEDVARADAGRDDGCEEPGVAVDRWVRAPPALDVGRVSEVARAVQAERARGPLLAAAPRGVGGGRGVGGIRAAFPLNALAESNFANDNKVCALRVQTSSQRQDEGCLADFQEWDRSVGTGA